MIKKEKYVFLLAATVGLFSFTIPWIIEKGFTWETLRIVCTNFGIGVLASVLVLLFTRILALPEKIPVDIESFITYLQSDKSRFSSELLSEIQN